MSTNRVTATSETVPDCWTELDDLFFTLVGDVLSTSFLWGAATLLASYDPDLDLDDVEPAATAMARQSGPSVSLPGQRSLAA